MWNNSYSLTPSINRCRSKLQDSCYFRSFNCYWAMFQMNLGSLKTVVIIIPNLKRFVIDYFTQKVSFNLLTNVSKLTLKPLIKKIILVLLCIEKLSSTLFHLSKILFAPPFTISFYSLRKYCISKISRFNDFDNVNSLERLSRIQTMKVLVIAIY